MPLGGEDHVDQAGAGSDPRAVSGAVNLDTSERGRIDEQGPVRRDARTVAGRLNGDRQPLIGRKPHRGHDIVAPRRPHHHRRALAHRPVPRRARALEAAVLGRQHRAPHRGPKGVEGVRAPDAHPAST